MTTSDTLNRLLEEDRQLVWTQQEAIDLAIAIEAIAPAHGCHVALTGGCLYKTPDPELRRKDADILFYRIRQVEAINQEALFNDLFDKLGMTIIKGHGWVYKALTSDGKPVDLFFPEENKIIRASGIENTSIDNYEKDQTQNTKARADNWLNTLIDNDVFKEGMETLKQNIDKTKTDAIINAFTSFDGY